MLWKPPPVVVDDAKPFESDRFDRQPYVENLAAILANSPEPLVLVVDGPWGAGKTVFLAMLASHLRGAGVRTLSFNAWEHDFVGDPMVALIGELSAELAQDGRVAPDRLTRIKTLGAAVAQRAIPLAIRAASAGLVDAAEAGAVLRTLAEGAGDEIASTAEAQLAQYRDAKSQVSDFRMQLEALATTLKVPDRAGASLVYFVDELDRCRPDFAIATLERIKHLFSVPGVAFVLGMNHGQLANAIRATYGAGTDAELYTERLVDLRFRLPSVRPDKFIDEAAVASGLKDACQGRLRGSEDLFVITGILKGVLATHSTFTARLAQRCLARAVLILRTTPPRTHLHSPALIALLILKELQPDLYDGYVAGRTSAHDVVAALGGLANPDPRAPVFPGTLAGVARAYMYAFSRVPGEAEKRREEAASAEGADVWDSEAEAERDSLLQLRHNARDLDHLDARIELAVSFK